MRWHQSEPAPRLVRWRSLLGAAIGLGLTAAVAPHVSVRDLVRSLATLGTIAPGLVLLSGLRFALQAAGWRLAIPAADRPDWGSAVRGVVAGEAVGFLAWGGVAAREPVKVWFVRHRCRSAAALAASIVERALYAISAAMVAAVAVGVLIHPWVVVAAVGAAVSGLITWQVRRGGTPQPARRRPVTHRVPPRPARVRPWTRRWRRRIVAGLTRVWRHRRATLMAILGLALLQQSLLVGETWLLLEHLRPPASVREAVLIEGGTKAINTAGSVVPGRIGVAEGGTAAMTTGLGLGAGLGVELVLARRARAVLWSAAGLVLLAWQSLTTHRRLRKTTARADATALPEVLEVQS